jgi:peptide/nickel transport system permease protein
MAVEVALAIFAPVLSALVTHYDPNQQDLVRTFAGPGSSHWLGTDQLGRDTLTRLLYGAQVSLGVAGLTVAIAVTLGVAVGVTAGFYGGWVDGVLMRLVDAILAIPPLFFLLLLSILFRPNVLGLAVVIATISWVGVARLVRGDVLATRHLDFVMAARAVGVGDLRLISRHIFPAVVPITLVAASLGVAQVILTEAALSFLGLGIAPPAPSWGNMITAAQTYYGRAVYLAVFPGLAIFVTVLAVNAFGNALRDALDPSLS